MRMSNRQHISSFLRNNLKLSVLMWCFLILLWVSGTFAQVCPGNCTAIEWKISTYQMEVLQWLHPTVESVLMDDYNDNITYFPKEIQNLIVAEQELIDISKWWTCEECPLVAYGWTLDCNTPYVAVSASLTWDISKQWYTRSWTDPSGSVVSTDAVYNATSTWNYTVTVNWPWCQNVSQVVQVNDKSEEPCVACDLWWSVEPVVSCDWWDSMILVTPPEWVPNISIELRDIDENWDSTIINLPSSTSYIGDFHGSYTVRIIDEDNIDCFEDLQVVIDLPTYPEITLSELEPFCPILWWGWSVWWSDQSVQASVEGSADVAYTYQWSVDWSPLVGETGSSLELSPWVNTSYTVQVTDTQTQCSSTKTVSAYVQLAPSLTVDSTNETCVWWAGWENWTITVQWASQATLSWVWPDWFVSDGSSLENLSPGVYTASIQHWITWSSNKCEGEQLVVEIFASENDCVTCDWFALEVSAPELTCDIQHTTPTVNVTLPTAAAWTDTATIQVMTDTMVYQTTSWTWQIDLNQLSAGTYTVTSKTVVNGIDCELSAPLVIDAVVQPEIWEIGSINIDCSTNSALLPSVPWSVWKNSDAETLDSLSVTESWTYRVQIDSDQWCSAFQDVEVVNNCSDACLWFEVDVVASSVSQPSTCGAEDGSFDITISAPSGELDGETVTIWDDELSDSIENGSATVTVSNLGAGLSSFDIQVQKWDDLCKWSASVTLTETTPIFDVLSEWVACYGDLEWWSLTVDAPAGAEVVMNGQIVDPSTDLSDVWPGQYTFVVNENGCESEPKVVVIWQPDEIGVLPVQSGENLCPLSQNVSVELLPTWGTWTKIVTWDDGLVPEDLGAWVYWYSITDENSCTKTWSVTVWAWACSPLCNGDGIELSENEASAQVECASWSSNCSLTCMCEAWTELIQWVCKKIPESCSLTATGIPNITDIACDAWSVWRIDATGVFGGDDLSYSRSHDGQKSDLILEDITQPWVYTITATSWTSTTCNVSKTFVVNWCLSESCPDTDLLVTAAQDTLTCSVLATSLTYWFTNQIPATALVSQQWSLEWWTQSFSNNITVNTAWTYGLVATVTLWDGTQCPYVWSVQIWESQSVPELVVSNPDPITCEKPGSRTLAVTNVQQWWTYSRKDVSWTEVSTQSIFVTSIPWIYTVTATDPTTWCSSSSATGVVELVNETIGVNCHPACTLDPTLSFVHPTCPENDNGSLLFASGTINWQTEIEVIRGDDDETMWTGLTDLWSGSYLATVSYLQDAQSCTINLMKTLVDETCFPIPDTNKITTSRTHCEWTAFEETFTDEDAYEDAKALNPTCIDKTKEPDACIELPEITVTTWEVWCDDDSAEMTFEFTWENPVNQFSLILTNKSILWWTWNIQNWISSNVTTYILEPWVYEYEIDRTWSCDAKTGEFEVVDSCVQDFDCVRPDEEPEQYTFCTPNNTDSLTVDTPRVQVAHQEECTDEIPCQWYAPSACGSLDDQRMIRFRLNDALLDPSNFCDPSALWKSPSENWYDFWRLLTHEPIHDITKHGELAQKEFYGKWTCELPWWSVNICELYVSKPPLCKDLDLQTTENEDGTYDISWKTGWITSAWRPWSAQNPSILITWEQVASTEDSSLSRAKSSSLTLVWESYVAVWVEMSLDGEDEFTTTTTCEKIIFLEWGSPEVITSIWWWGSDTVCGGLDSQYVDIEPYLFNSSEKADNALCDDIPNEDVEVQYLTREWVWIWTCPSADGDVDVSCEAYQGKNTKWKWWKTVWATGGNIVSDVSSFVSSLPVVDLDSWDSRLETEQKVSVQEIRDVELVNEPEEQFHSAAEVMVEESIQTRDQCCYEPVENNSFEWVSSQQDAMIQTLNEKLCVYEWRSNSRDFQPDSCLHRGELVKAMTHLAWAWGYDIRTKASRSKELRWVTYADALRVSWYDFFRSFDTTNTYECARLDEIYDMFAWVLEKYNIEPPAELRENIWSGNMKRIDFVELQTIILAWLESSQVERTCEEPKEWSQCCYAPLGQWANWAGSLQEVNNALCVFEWHDNSWAYDTSWAVTYGQLRKILVHLNGLWSYDNTKRADAQGEWRAAYYWNLLEEKWLTSGLSFDQSEIYSPVAWRIFAELIEASYIYNGMELTVEQKQMITKIGSFETVSRGAIADWLVEIIQDLKQWATKPQCKF